MKEKKTPSDEIVRATRVEYLVLLGVIVLLTMMFFQWCGPSLRKTLFSAGSLAGVAHAAPAARRPPARDKQPDQAPASPRLPWKPLIPLTLDSKAGNPKTISNKGRTRPPSRTGKRPALPDWLKRRQGSADAPQL